MSDAGADGTEKKKRQKARKEEKEEDQARADNEQAVHDVGYDQGRRVFILKTNSRGVGKKYCLGGA